MKMKIVVVAVGEVVNRDSFYSLNWGMGRVSKIQIIRPREVHIL
jgi:hypothetical protein